MDVLGDAIWMLGEVLSLALLAYGLATAFRANRLQPERRDRLLEAAQGERPDGLGVGEAGDVVLGLRVEQDLPRARRAA
jgi:hypothetical protein